MMLVEHDGAAFVSSNCVIFTKTFLSEKFIFTDNIEQENSQNKCVFTINQLISTQCSLFVQCRQADVVCQRKHFFSCYYFKSSGGNKCKNASSLSSHDPGSQISCTIL